MHSKTRRILTAIGSISAVIAPAAQGELAPSVEAQMPTGARQDSVWTFHHEHLLGTSVQISVRAADRKDASRAEAAALAMFDREENILSAWRPESEFSRWQQTRFEPVSVSEDLFTVLAAFEKWRGRTSGALDPSVEAATRLWQQTTSEGRTPTDEEIARTREAIAQPHWALDAAHRTATRLSDVPLALASFTKSWITSKAADAALATGATGIMINVGGDVVVRGAMTQVVSITDPKAIADNDLPLEYVAVRDRAVATSGGYRRGFEVAEDAALRAPSFSHLIDPRAATPVSHVLSSTVIAKSAETAGALATAFSVLSEQESLRLAQDTPGVEYLLVMADGRKVASGGWGNYQIGGGASTLLRPAAYAAPSGAKAGVWDPQFELAVELNLPRIDDARYRRPYVAVWIEDSDHFPVRTLALWTQNPRWLPELKRWYHDDQIRNLSEGTDISRTVSSATRPPGKYNLVWDGKDNEGKPVKAGTYSVVVEVSREHGGYQVEHREINFTGKPARLSTQAGQELGTITLDYRKH